VNPSLLAFKYKTIKLGEQYTEKQTSGLGWKCRKYIRWSDVHVGEDRDVLKSFGDTAVDNLEINYSLLPRINEILVNVQRWRLDKENLAVEPDFENSWNHANQLVLAAQSEFQVAVNYVAEKTGNFESVSGVDVRSDFLKIIIYDLVLSGLRDDRERDYSCISLPIDEIFKGLKGAGSQIHELSAIFQIEDASIMAVEFGLPELLGSENVGSFIPTTSVIVDQVIEERLPGTELFRVSEVAGTRIISLNSDNECVSMAMNDSRIRDHFIRFMSVFATTTLETSRDQALLDFNKLLALNLNREFRK
jgi:hypothetical protein